MCGRLSFFFLSIHLFVRYRLSDCYFFCLSNCLRLFRRIVVYLFFVFVKFFAPINRLALFYFRYNLDICDYFRMCSWYSGTVGSTTLPSTTWWACHTSSNTYSSKGSERYVVQQGFILGLHQIMNWPDNRYPAGYSTGYPDE